MGPLPARGRKTALFLVLILAAQLTAPAALGRQSVAQADPRDLTGAFDCPEGLRVTLWAETPQLYNPTAMNVDARGRVWVAEAVDYRRWNGRNPGYAREGGDRIVVLSGRDHCTKATVFAQDEDLVAPLGICVLADRVLVSCSPHVIEYVDRDGDNVADDKRVFLTGFGGHDHDHGLHSFTAGPDGRLYFNVGNAGPHLVTDRAGFSLRSGSIYVGGGARAADNRPGLMSDDGRAWTGGLVLRVEQDGTALSVLAHNFRNPYEVALDSFGSMYLRDNDDDGNQGCRTVAVLEGGDHGFFSADGSRTWQADRRPGQPVPRAHWHADDPGVAPPGTIDGSGGPTGVVVYEGELLAPWIGGRVLGADAGRGLVFAHTPRAAGAGAELEPGVLIAARADEGGRPASWFRPSNVAVSTDGSVLVADWYDPVVGGHAMRDGEAYGRILRLLPAGRAPFRPGYALDRLDGQVKALLSPAVNVRLAGFRALRARGEAAVPALVRLFEQRKEPHVRARLVWLLAGLGNSGRKVVVDLLDDLDPDLRLVAYRALRAEVVDHLPWARELAADSSAAVRREVAISLRDEPFARCADVLLELARGYDGADRAYLEAIGIAAEGHEETLYPVLADELGDKPAEWDARFAGLSWRLHPEAAVPAFFARAMDVRLAPEARAQAVDALAFTPARAAAEATLNLALAGPPDVRALAGWWIRHRDANDWAEYGLMAELGIEGREGAEQRYASGVISSGELAIEVDLSDAEVLWLVVSDGGDGNSYDWADWIEPRLVGPKGELKLTELAWEQAGAQWGEVRVDRNAGGGPLVANGQPVAFGIGTHAHSEIAWRVPEGYERFVCRAAPDDGGTSQQGSRTTVRFEVHVQLRRDDDAMREAARVLLDPERSESERVELARELAARPEGGMLLVELASVGLLEPRLKEAVAEPLFRNPDVTVRTLASEHFQRPLDPGPPLPPIRELAAIEGDRRRGQELFFGQKALCSSCHAWGGRGGAVGPDLTSVREKLGREALLDALLNPNAGIAFGWDTWVIRTQDGLLYSGFLLADGERIVLKDTRGERHVIESADVEERSKLSISTMPDNVGLGLEPHELADLATFMLHDPEAEPTLGEPIALFDGEGLAGWTHFLADPQADPAEVWTVEDGVLTCAGHPPGYLRTEAAYRDFVLELEWRFPPGAEPGNSGVLLRQTGADAIWPRSIEAQLLHTNAGDLWNIGEFPMQVEAARTRGRRTAKLAPSSEKPLGEWNRYRITLNGGELRLEVNGVLQNRARWCEEIAGHIGLQSEGARIQFRDISLRPILR